MTSMTGSMGYKDKVPSGYKVGQVQQFSPEQLNLFKSLFSHLGPDSFLSKLAGGDQSEFEALEAPALRQFQELQGGLASRFSGMGLGARRGSGFQNASTQATQDFATGLQSQRLGLRSQALKELLGMSNELLGQRPFERTLNEKPKSFLESFGTSAAGGFGKSIGSGLFF